MGRFLLALTVIALMWASRVAAGGAPTAVCCGCEPSSGPALFCAVVSSSEEHDSAGLKCQEMGGMFLCKASMLGSQSCSFEGLNCPATGAPAMGGRSLGALVALLGAAGVIALRRRATRS